MNKSHGTHWLAAQWSLWSHDSLCGRLPVAGFSRWATCIDGRVRPVQGEGWGSHWQENDLRLAPWGCWLEESGFAWAYLAARDQCFMVESWHPQATNLEHARPVEMGHALAMFQQAVLIRERRIPSLEKRWALLADLQHSKLVSAQAARSWYVQIGSQLLQECAWHQEPGSLRLTGPLREPG